MNSASASSPGRHGGRDEEWGLGPSADAACRLRFGRLEADLQSEELLIDGHPLDIEPQPRMLLLYLIRHRDRVVSRQELHDAIWGAKAVGVTALYRAILKLRQALAKVSSGSVLSTRHRVGYRFVAEPDATGMEPAMERLDCVSLALLPFDHAEDADLARLSDRLHALAGEIMRSDPRIALAQVSSPLRASPRMRTASVHERAAFLERVTGARAVGHARVVRSAGGVGVHFKLFVGGKVASGSVAGSTALEAAVGLAQAFGAHLGCTVDFGVAAHGLPRDSVALEAYLRGHQAFADERYATSFNLFRLAHEMEPGHFGIALKLLKDMTIRTDSDDELRALAAQLTHAAGAAVDRAARLRDVHLTLARWHLHRFQHQPAAAELDRAIELADGREDPVFWAEAHQFRALLAQGRARYDEAREHVAKCRRLRTAIGDRAGLTWLALYEAGLTDPEQGAVLALEAARGARDLGLSRTLAAACNNACLALIGLGRLTEAVCHAAEGFSAAVSVQERHKAETLAGCCAWAGRLAGWPSVTERVIAELDGLPGRHHIEHGVLGARGFLHGSRGEWAQAAIYCARAYDSATVASFRTFVLPWYAEALMFSGREDEAQDLIARVDLSSSTKYDHVTHLLLMRAALAHRRGARAEALGLLGQVLARGPAPMWHAWATVDAAWLNAEEGRSAEAARLLEVLAPQLATLPVVIATRARVRHAAGDLHGALTLHREYVAARKEPGWNEYFRRLGTEYEAHAGGPRHALPATPFLPSRSC